MKVPDAPGVGIEINAEAARRYLVDVEMKAKGQTLFASLDQVVVRAHAPKEMVHVSYTSSLNSTGIMFSR